MTIETMATASELRLCPACGALPCDWTDDPYKPLNSQAILDSCGTPPAIGDRKEVNGQTVVWMPDPWAYNVAFPAWCSLAALHRDGIIPPPSPPAKAPTMDAIEAVARALYGREVVPGAWLAADADTRVMYRRLATAALSAARPFIAAEWQPIETAPKDGTRFVGLYWKEGAWGGWRSDARTYWCEGLVKPCFVFTGWGSSSQPLYWQPLPAPPTAIKETIR